MPYYGGVVSRMHTPLSSRARTMGNIEATIKKILIGVVVVVVLIGFCVCFCAVIACIYKIIHDKHGREKQLQQAAYQVQSMDVSSGFSSQYDLKAAQDQIAHQQAVRDREKQGAFFGGVAKTLVAPETLAF